MSEATAPGPSPSRTASRMYRDKFDPLDATRVVSPALSPAAK
jgi:hypothetical protein